MVWAGKRYFVSLGGHDVCIQLVLFAGVSVGGCIGAFPSVCLVFLFLNIYILGRWWVVGSAWTGWSSQAEGMSSTGFTGSGVLGKGLQEAWILDKAKQQRMNADLRKTLFGGMTSEVGGGLHHTVGGVTSHPKRSYIKL